MGNKAVSSCTTRLAAPPAAGATQTPSFPWKAMERPSGDQTGARKLSVVSVVSAIGRPPATGWT